MRPGSHEGELWSLSDERRERLETLSPSAKFVYVVLQSEGTLDQDEIVQRTLLPKRTVRYALDKLERADLVSEEPGVTDARRRRYRPTAMDEGETG